MRLHLLLIAIVLTSSVTRVLPQTNEADASDSRQSSTRGLLIEVVDRDNHPLDSVQVRVEGRAEAYYSDRNGRVELRFDSQTPADAAALLNLVGRRGVSAIDTVRTRAAKSGYSVAEVTPLYIVTTEKQSIYTQRYVLVSNIPGTTSGPLGETRDVGLSEHTATGRIVVFVIQDMSGSRIPGVEIRRDGISIGRSSNDGYFTDTLKHAMPKCRYLFLKAGDFEPSQIVIGLENLVGEHTNRNVVMTQSQLSIQCVDTTGLYSSMMEGIQISRHDGTVIGLTDRHGWYSGVPSKYLRDRIRLTFSKQDIFPTQENLLESVRSGMANVILTPRVGSLIITVTRGGPIVRDVQVAIRSDNYAETRSTNDDGIAVFRSPRIRPGTRFLVEVGSEKLPTWIVDWQSEREFPMSQ